MDIICPILKTSGSCSSATGTDPPSGQEPSSAIDNAIAQATGPEAVTDTSIQTGGFEEGFIQIKNTRIYGLRTYSIILIIVGVYAYLCIKTGDALGMKDLALMACGFLFGIKSLGRSSR